MKTDPEYFDVVIVGAGLSGIGAACHLLKECPNHRYIILEARASMGGTWDLFRYPGVRSDSDMHTLGYGFRPWDGSTTITDGSSILDYLLETAQEYTVEHNVRYNQKLKAADWSSENSCWTLEIEDTFNNKKIKLSTNFLHMCSGYYDYKTAHKPDLPNLRQFKGTLVNPQFWPEKLDYLGKRVVVIGSGATAVSIVPSMAETAQHVTMLQRSPSYFLSWPSKDQFTSILKMILPRKWAHSLTRLRYILFQELLYKLTRVAPILIKKRLIGRVRRTLGSGFDIEKHFTPDYNPWDQRLCLVPDNDFFSALRSRKASVVTDNIARFTATGILLESGTHLDADIVVTATGLKLIVLGGVKFSIDRKPVDISQAWSYKALMITGVPNMVSTFGYVNASWTLRSDITAKWVCKVLNHMTRTNTTSVVPYIPAEFQQMEFKPWIADFPAGYIKRVMHLFPKQGFTEPWLNSQDFRQDKKMFNEPLETDKSLKFT